MQSSKRANEGVFKQSGGKSSTEGVSPVNSVGDDNALLAAYTPK
jgi:hypothetical protein